jgi:hypothetical protein
MSTTPLPSDDLNHALRATGIVAVGRNEGQRLKRCLTSIAGGQHPCVYVDSGSTDGSLDLARQYPVEVIALDPATRMTAARARNAGLAHLMQRRPDLRFIQFIDADCVLAADWLEIGLRRLLAKPELAAVAGRRCERHPNATVYNHLMAIEWDTPLGATETVGGDCLLRCDAFERVGGFRADLICGEEPELCYRLRADRWQIERIGMNMTVHDAAMTRFRQWWRRCVRGGWAYAEGAVIYQDKQRMASVRRIASAVVWAGLVPAATIGISIFGTMWAAVMLGCYPLLAGKILVSKRCQQYPWASAGLYALACIVSKWPELQGQMTFVGRQVFNWQSGLIEYKNPGLMGPSQS